MALDRLSEWCKQWQLNLSVAKCGSLVIGDSNNWMEGEDLSVGGCCLSNFEFTKDLGVIIDSRLAFNKHIDAVVASAKRRCYLLFKSFKSRDIHVMMFAYKVYVLPLLEYCSSIWCPSKLSDVDRIEKVQRSFTKKLHGLTDMSYNERLVSCNLPTLEIRRLRTDLILCFKIVHRLIALNFSDFFEFDTNHYNTRGNSLKLKLPLARNSVRKNFFAVRVVPPWNSLHEDVVMATDVCVFKSKLLYIDLGMFAVRT